MIVTAVYDTKPYDKEHLASATGTGVEWHFHDFRLSAATSSAAEGAQAVCVFVNDNGDRACLEKLVGFDIYGKTVGIVGTGRIGKIAAQIFSGFEAKVVAYDPFPAHDWAGKYGVRYVDLDTLLALKGTTL